MPSKPNADTKNKTRFQAKREKELIEIERIEYERFLEVENIRLEKELKNVQLEKNKLEKAENERIARIAYFKKKQEAEDAKIAERRERQKIAAEISGGGDGFSSRGVRKTREENDRSEDEEQYKTKRSRRI